MTERELLIDCLRRLNRAEIDYMLTGSMVSNYWGIPKRGYIWEYCVKNRSESTNPP